MYTLKYVGPEPDCGRQWDLETPEDIFIKLSELIVEDFEYCGEVDFDRQDIKDIVSALKGSSYKTLIKAINSYLLPSNGDYYLVKEKEQDVPNNKSFRERKEKVLSIIDRLREDWQKWKDKS